VSVVGPQGPLAAQKVTLVSVTRDQKLSQRDQTADSQGRVRFEKIPPSPDTGYLIAIKYQGSAYNSAPFKMPDKPGMKVELRVFPPTRDGSQVVLGPQSHIGMELGDGQLEVIENIVLENRGEATWEPGPGGLVFALPDGATGARPAEEAPQLKIVEHRGAVWTGPVAPGRTQLRFGFVLPFKAADLAFQQTMPLAMDGVRVIVERSDRLEIDGPIVKAREEKTLSGRRFWLVGSDDKLPAPAQVAFSLHNLPVPDHQGAYAALACSLGIALWGLMMGRAPGRPGVDADRKRKLAERREKLLGELVVLEEQRKGGRLDEARWKPRREELVASLERVYRELDADELA
jgi:hypothetical protein